MPTTRFIDILVVGAGPAGSRAAAAAARQGAQTVLVDAKPRIGEQPHCGEYVPTRLFAEAQLDRSAVLQSVDCMETRVLSAGMRGTGRSATESAAVPKRTLKVISSPFPGFIIDRVRFDRDLAREAAFQGVTVLCSTRVVRRVDEGWVLKCGKEEMTMAPQFVIAADGAVSTVAAILGLTAPNYLRGVQAEVPLVQPLENTVIFLDRDFFGGYGWLFPKGKTANVGLGVAAGNHVHPAALLEKFLAHLSEQGLIRPGKLARSSGLIPVSGIRRELAVDNIVFCGDAAGLTHPITGAGIPQAVFSGDLAGRYAAEALRTGNRRLFVDYQAEITGWYGGVIGHAVAKRLLMMRLWEAPDFQRVCEETWIGFKGYRKRFRLPDTSQQSG